MEEIIQGKENRQKPTDINGILNKENRQKWTDSRAISEFVVVEFGDKLVCVVRKQGESSIHLRIEGDHFCFGKLDKPLSSMVSRFLFQLILSRETNISN